jgi:hypothetical protein
MMKTTIVIDPPRPPFSSRCRQQPMLPLLLLLFWLCLLPWAPPARGEVLVAPAQGAADEKEEQPEQNDESLLERTIEAIDEGHEQISRRVLASAQWIDSFFASERLDAEAQETRLRLGFSLFAEDSEGVEFDLATGFHLSLPFASERLQLVFSGDPEDNIGSDTVARQELRRRLREQREQTISVGLRYQWRHRLLSNASLRGGVRVRDGSLVLLLEPRYRQDIPFGDSWLFRFTQRLIAYSDDTYEVRTIFDLERPLPELSEAFFFRLTTEGNWLSDEPGYGYAVHLNLFQTLSPRRVLDYRISNYFQTRPNDRRESTVLSILYRQMLGRDWLYSEVAPQLAFPRERNFQPTLGILLNMGVILGSY